MKSRDDIFIIWGNGVKHLFPIVDRIRADGSYEIINIIKHHVNNMNEFIRNVYKCDSVPYDHLIAKTRYLLRAAPVCYTVYVKNNNVDERYFGEGPFSHIRCATIKKTKEDICNMFNPRIGNRRTEEHVIHGTDYSAQTEYLKKLFNIPNKIDHVFKNLPTQYVNVDELYCNIIDKGIVKINASPQYQFVCKDEQPYINYISKHCGISFDVGKSDGIIVRKDNNRLIIVDGLHRASIILNQNNNANIKVYVQ